MMCNSELRTEEDVKVKFLLPFLAEHGYEPSQCEFEKAIDVQEGRKHKKIFADVVVYTSSKKQAPIILCETKPPQEILNKSVKEQAISYARLLPRIAPLALITNGSQIQVFQTLSKNRISQLPHFDELQSDLVNLIISSEVQTALREEAKHDLFIIDDVQTFKNILKSCHNEIRNNEGYDPAAAFDEMSKVLFCKLYEEKHNGNNRFRLDVFDDALDNLKINVVKQVFDETKSDPRYSGLFDKDDTINLQDRTIRKIVSLFENYDLSLTAFDVKGEAFEYFLGDTFTGGLGEYFTPRNIVEFMIDAINPKIGDKIIDPFCGTGGFLIYAFDVISEKIHLQEFSEEEKGKWRYKLSNESLFGTDWKERTSQACKMNMMVHGDGNTGIFMHHGLVNIENQIEDGKFRICVTNPPFGSFENDPAILMNYDLGAGRKSQDRVILAIERAIRLVNSNGLVGIIVIDGILNTNSKKYVRDYIRENAWIKAVISLTEETFEGYGARAKTSILLLQKKTEPDDGKQNHVFMAIAKNTGYAPNGSQIPGNELPDILLDYKSFSNNEFKDTKQSNSWISDVAERLDAEYYFDRAIGIDGNKAFSLEKEVSELLDTANKEYCILNASMTDVLKNRSTKATILGDLIQEVEFKERVIPDKLYKLLGVRWWGGGAFKREEKFGSEIKAKYLYKVSTGWIIYNRLFAYRGSFALLKGDHDDCYVSAEFPTFKIKNGIKKPETLSKYIVYCLNSPYYQKETNKESTGSTKTSRNRLNQKQLLDMKLEIPIDDVEIDNIVKLIDHTNLLRANQVDLLERVKELHDQISAKAFGRNKK
jgi:type I restriction enzyme M protein